MKSPAWERLKGQWLELIADKRRRLLLVIGVVLLLLGFIYRVFPYFEGIKSDTAEIVAQKTRIAKYRQAVRQKSEIEARLLAYNKSLEKAEAGLLAGETPALAAVDIQNALKEIVLGSGVEIKSTRILKPQNQKQETALYVKVPVNFSLDVSIRQLKDILYKIETYPKFFLTVELMVIYAARAANPGQINCNITVYGIMKPVKEAG